MSLAPREDRECPKSPSRWENAVVRTDEQGVFGQLQEMITSCSGDKRQPLVICVRHSDYEVFTYHDDALNQKMGKKYLNIVLVRHPDELGAGGAGGATP